LFREALTRPFEKFGILTLAENRNGCSRVTVRKVYFNFYKVVLDLGRSQAFSGSIDSTVRVWDLRIGECRHTLTGHTSLVGLLGQSPSFLPPPTRL
jgi:WD40 repeat protein